MSALRALLSGIVDYAGLFPPAALDMPAAVRNYASYRDDGAAWMLGRFVLPASRLTEFSAARSTLSSAPDEWALAALIGSDADIAAVRGFNASHRGSAAVDTLEVKIAQPADVDRFASLRDEFAVFAEVPLDGDVESLVTAIQRGRIHAKIRTGGVVPESIPAPERVVEFLRACLRAEVLFKATAGLHHPLRAPYRLTYASDAPVSVMYGYLNVFLAAAFMANGLSDAEAASLLDERRSTAFTVTGDGIAWNEHFLTTAQLSDARRHVAASFGSCSFREPADELRALALVT